MPLVRQSVNPAGGSLRTVRDTAGNLIQLSVDATGKILGARPVGQ